MTKEEIIRQVLKNVFEKLTINESVFIELFGFKTAEISVRGLLKKVGIGYYEQGNTILKVFFINDHYEKADSNRFKPVLSIGYRIIGSKKEAAWNIEFSDEAILVKEVGSLPSISSDMQALYYIIQDIEYEERELAKS